MKWGAVCSVMDGTTKKKRVDWGSGTVERSVSCSQVRGLNRHKKGQVDEMRDTTKYE